MSEQAVQKNYLAFGTSVKSHSLRFCRNWMKCRTLSSSINPAARRLRRFKPSSVFPLPRYSIRVYTEDVFGDSAKRETDVPYSAQIRNAANRYSLDPALVASVIAAESNFNPRAVSKKSALGLMQLLPETAAQLAVPNAFDPTQNINGGTRYLRQLLDRYKQNLSLALAAYNAGPRRVDFYHGIPPIAETRSYINRVVTRLQSQPNLMREFFADSGKQNSSPAPAAK